MILDSKSCLTINYKGVAELKDELHLLEKSPEGHLTLGAGVLPPSEVRKGSRHTKFWRARREDLKGEDTTAVLLCPWLVLCLGFHQISKWIANLGKFWTRKVNTGLTSVCVWGGNSLFRKSKQMALTRSQKLKGKGCARATGKMTC